VCTRNFKAEETELATVVSSSVCDFEAPSYSDEDSCVFMIKRVSGAFSDTCVLFSHCGLVICNNLPGVSVGEEFEPRM